jgi:hypothetical protein
VVGVITDASNRSKQVLMKDKLTTTYLVDDLRASLPRPRRDITAVGRSGGGWSSSLHVRWRSVVAAGRCQASVGSCGASVVDGSGAAPAGGVAVVGHAGIAGREVFIDDFSAGLPRPGRHVGTAAVG